MADDSKKVFSYFVRVKKDAYDEISKALGVNEKITIESAGDEIGFVSEKISEDRFLKTKEDNSNSIINYIRILDVEG